MASVEAARFRQFPTALRFSLRNQSRNRLAAILLVAFVPLWYLLMMAMIPDSPLPFRLFGRGVVLKVDGRELTFITASPPSGGPSHSTADSCRRGTSGEP
jgi:hypothetical protein